MGPSHLYHHSTLVPYPTREITRCCGILDLLEPPDSVMADKGFDIEPLLESRGAKLNLPPFLETRDQFTKEQVLDTKTLQVYVSTWKEQ